LRRNATELPSLSIADAAAARPARVHTSLVVEPLQIANDVVELALAHAAGLQLAAQRLGVVRPLAILPPPLPDVVRVPVAVVAAPVPAVTVAVRTVRRTAAVRAAAILAALRVLAVLGTLTL
jgi:hypothetical protein